MTSTSEHPTEYLKAFVYTPSHHVVSLSTVLQPSYVHKSSVYQTMSLGGISVFRYIFFSQHF